MANAEFVRVKMHPWLWLGIVKTAILRHTKAQDLSLTSRRKAADVLKLLDAKWDADANFASPYMRVPGKMLAEWRKRNDEIMAADPLYGRFTEIEFDDPKAPPEARTVKSWGYREIPNPDLAETIDLAIPQRDYCCEAVEAWAKLDDVDNSNARGMVDAVDALRGGAPIEIDTAQFQAGAKDKKE